MVSTLAMFLLIRRNLSHRPARTTLTALAIALGVGFILAMRIVGAAIALSSEDARQSRLAGADLEVTAATGSKIPESLVAQISGRSQVELATPILRALEGVYEPNQEGGVPNPLLASGTLKGTGLALLGVEPGQSLIAYELAAGAIFSKRDAAELLLPENWAADRGISPGDDLDLSIGKQTGLYRVVGLRVSEAQDRLAQPAAWLPLGAMQAALDTPGEVDAILVRLRSGATPDQGRDQLQDYLGDQYIVTSSNGGVKFLSLFTMTSLALPFAGVVILLAGGFLVYNAFAITLAERRREIGQLRLLGATRGQIRRQTILEALAVALIGSGLGLLLGWALGRLISGYVGRLQGNDSLSQIPVPLDGIALALGAGIVVTLGVTYNLARVAGRVSPLEALRVEEPGLGKPSRQALFLALPGVILLFLALTSTSWTELVFKDLLRPSYGPMFSAALLFGFGALAILPLWVTGAIWAAERFSAFLASRGGGRLGRAGIAGQLAVGAQSRKRQRATLTAATLAISLAIVITLSGIALYFQEFLLVFDKGMLAADFAIARPYPPGTSFEDLAILPNLPPIPADLAADLATLEDLATTYAYANVSLPGLGVESGFGDRYAFSMDLEKLRNNPMFPAFEGSWEEAEAIFAAGPALMLPELTARRLDKHPGDNIQIDTLRGETEFTVALVGGGFPIVTPQIAQEYFGSHPLIILIDARPGVDPAAVEARIKEIVARHPLETATLELEQLEGIIDDFSTPLVGLFSGLTSLSALVAGLGIVVTLIASVLERRREIGTLRALGMTRSQVRCVILLEAGLLSLAGASLGVVAGLGMSVTFSRVMILAIRDIAGITAVETAPVPWAVALAALIISPVIAILASIFPANRAANAKPAEAMRANE